MVSANEAVERKEEPREPDVIEEIDNIIGLIGDNKLYWAGIALCDLRERLKDAK